MIGPDRPGGRDRQERRRDGRTLLLYRSAAIRTATRQGIALVRNISPGGLKAQTRVPVLPGEMVTIELASRQPVTGTVAWAQGDTFGMRFAASVELAPLLGRMADAGASRRRMPRIALTRPARVTEAGRVHAVTIRDISVTGLCIESGHGFAEPVVNVDLGALGAHPVRIVWSRDGVYGCAFVDCLDWAALGRWVDAAAEAAAA